ncbi:hypothetical protein BX600DRAFT_71962 [Xylariales sp. PMI_506]|nr:hypothetical protein BX600DRAFT_71962 [Xylariales sp. PMI_506]
MITDLNHQSSEKTPSRTSPTTNVPTRLATSSLDPRSSNVPRYSNPSLSSPGRYTSLSTDWQLSNTNDLRGISSYPVCTNDRQHSFGPAIFIRNSYNCWTIPANPDKKLTSSSQSVSTESRHSFCNFF